MKRFLQAMAIVGVLIAIFVLVVGLMPNDNSAPDQVGGTKSQQFNELIDPYEICKNPYLWRGHSGILDTKNIHVVGSDGRRFSMPSLAGTLRFEKMIDEHTATYEVLDGRLGLGETSEIAVRLEDSNPPKIGPPWRIVVEGPMEGVNALGASVTITAVRFEGYGELPVESVTPPPAAPPPAVEKQAPTPAENPAEPLEPGTQPPAPIIRNQDPAPPNGSI